MNTRSLRFQLTAWYASLVTGVFVLLGVVLVLGLSHYLKASLAETQLRRARQIAQTLLARMDQTGEGYVTNEIKSVYAPELNSRFLRITRQGGGLLYASGPPNDFSFLPEEVPPVVGPVSREFALEARSPAHDPVMIGVLPFKTSSGPWFIVEVGASTAPIQAMVDRLKLQLLVGLPLVLAVAVGGGYLLVGRALSPVDQIAGKAEQITQHNLGERLPVARTGDELERLSVSLNRMIARLEDAFLNARRFGADASHELRTPLTVLRGELESVVQDARLAADLKESLGSVLEEVERLVNTVEGLFAISRLDAGEAQAEWRQFDLAELAVTTADHMALLAEDKGISIQCEAPAPVLVQGDRARLKQVVVNLLDNAIKYTPDNGTVTLRVSATSDRARLEVEDNGIGIPPEALPHVFDRFFRVDKARSHRDPGGAGLGLSIVKSICTAHGADIKVHSTPGQGSCFQLDLPLATGPKSISPQPHEH